MKNGISMSSNFRDLHNVRLKWNDNVLLFFARVKLEWGYRGCFAEQSSRRFFRPQKMWWPQQRPTVISCSCWQGLVHIERMFGPRTASAVLSLHSSRSADRNALAADPHIQPPPHHSSSRSPTVLAIRLSHPQLLAVARHSRRPPSSAVVFSQRKHEIVDIILRGRTT